MQSVYRFRPFSLKTLRPDNTLLMLGHRGTGKGLVTQRIFETLPSSDMHYFTPSPDVDEFYDQKHITLHKKWDQDEWSALIETKKIERIAAENKRKEEERELIQLCSTFKEVEKLLKRQKKQKEEPKSTSFVFWSQCGSYKEIMKSDVLKTLVNNGRHYNIGIGLDIQYMVDFPSYLRGGFDYVFVFRETTDINIKRIYDLYAGFFPSRKVFKRILMSMTEGMNCMVLDVRSQSTSLEDRVFYYSLPGEDEDEEEEEEKVRGEMKIALESDHNVIPLELQEQLKAIESMCHELRAQFTIDVEEEEEEAEEGVAREIEFSRQRRPTYSDDGFS